MTPIAIFCRLLGTNTQGLALTYAIQCTRTRKIYYKEIKKQIDFWICAVDIFDLSVAAGAVSSPEYIPSTRTV